MILKLKSLYVVTLIFGIGYKGKLPWNVPEEMKHFKNITTAGDNCVIMENQHTIVYLRSIDHCQIVIIVFYLRQCLHMIYAMMKKMFKYLILILNCCDTFRKEHTIVIGLLVENQFIIFFLTHYTNLISEIHLSVLKKSYKCDRYFNFDTECFKKIHHENKGEFEYQIYKNLMFK